MGKVSAQVLSLRKASEPVSERLELACPAHNFTSLRAAVENGANSIYIDYRPADPHTRLHSSLARDAGLRKGIRYAHEHKVKIALPLSQMHAGPDTWSASIAMIREASNLGIDAIALSDPALMLYASAHYPDLAIHYNVSESTIDADAIRLLKRSIPIARVILPRVVSVAQIEEVSRIPDIGVELIAFGNGCSILTPQATLPARVTAYPRSSAPEERSGDTSFSFSSLEDGVGLCGLPGQATNDQLFDTNHPDERHALSVLPQLAAIQVRTLRIELQDHSCARLARVTRVWREAIDECMQDTQHYNVRATWLAELQDLTLST